MKAVTLQLPSGLSLSVTLAGSEDHPAVVLVHGWTCRRGDWHQLMQALMDDYYCIALDLPGHGDSREQVVSPWSVERMGQVVAEAIESLGIDAPKLVGHSMGGAVVLEAARLLEAVQRVVLVDTFVIPYGDLTESGAKEIEQPFYDDFTSAINGLVDNFTHDSLGEDVTQRLKTQMGEADTGAMLPLWSDLLRWQPAAAFAELHGRTVPMHAVNGELIPDAARARCAPYIQETRLDRAAHFPHLEVPERFNEAMRAALA